MKPRRSSWINVVAAVVGGLALGWGVGQLVMAVTLAATAWTVIGVILLWWALSDYRKYRDGTPESETHGGHTIE